MYGYGNEWLWIVIVLFIVFFLVFWNNGNSSCGCQNHRCD